MFRKYGQPAATQIAVDLGAHQTRIIHHREGLILDEPSVGAIDMDHRIGGSRALDSFGNEALDIAATKPSMRIVQVLRSDARNPLGHSAKMLRYYFSRLRRDGSIGKAPVILLNIPPDISEHLTEDLKHACFTAGASRVHLVDNAISMAVGAGIDIADGAPRMLHDLGARAARLYAMQFNEIVAAYSLPFGGDRIDDALAHGIRERYGLYVTEVQAQHAKHLVGSAISSSLDNQLRNSCQMQGLQITVDEQANFTLTSEVACELLQPLMRQGREALDAAISALPYQFRDPQQDCPIIITGGGAHLPQMDQLVMETGNRPVEIADQPATTAVRGGATLLTHIQGEPAAAPA